MQAETLAALMGLGGAIVGAGLSTGAVIWQQRKTAHEAERMHLSGLAEAAANECIKISYALHKHFAAGVPDRNSSAYYSWGSTGEELCQALEEQALRFHDKAVRDFLTHCHADMYVRPEFVADPEPWPTRYSIITTDIRTVMGTVLRRQPFPKDIWESYPTRP